MELLRLVVDCGGFTSAARAAGVSQPAISRAMARLSEQLNEPLFRRAGRGVAPTPTALRLARAMREVDATLHAAGAPGQPDEAERRDVRVGVAPAAGLLYGPLMTAALSGRHRLGIVTGAAPAMLAALISRDLDVAIVPRPRGLDRPELCQHVMYVSRPAIYCRHGHALQAAASLRQIADAQWAVAGMAGTPGNVIEEAFRVRRWAAPKIAVQCADYGMLAQIVACSELLAVIPHPLLATRVREDGIRCLRIAEGLPNYEVCMFWRRDVVGRGEAVECVIRALLAQGVGGG